MANPIFFYAATMNPRYVYIGSQLAGYCNLNDFHPESTVRNDGVSMYMYVAYSKNVVFMPSALTTCT